MTEKADVYDRATEALALALHRSWCTCGGYGVDEKEHATATFVRALGSFRKKYDK